MSAVEGVVAPAAPQTPAATPPARRWRRGRPRVWRVSVLVLAAIFYLVPLLSSIKFSLIDKQGNYSAHNYTMLVTSAPLRSSLILSLEIAAITAGVVALLVFPTAVLVRLKLPQLTIMMEAITILPLVVPPIVLGAGMYGLKESLPLWLFNIFFNHPLTLLTPVYVILALPLAYRAIDTALRAVDLHTLVDASRSLGSGWAATLWRVILPNVQTGVLGGMFLTLALVLGEVVISSMMDLGSNTFPVEMLQLAQQDDAAGVAVALSLLALVFTFLLLFSLTFLARRRGVRR